MDALTRWRIPGNACEVYYQRRRVFRYAAGYADVASGRRMQGDERMFMYSATKPVVCATALTLWEQGKFVLSDPLKRYLPEWAEVTVRHIAPDGKEELRPPVRDVTVEDLFTMQSGLDYNYFAPALAEARERLAPVCPTREIARAIAAEPLLFDPGARWCYGYSHDILGALVEVIADMPLRDYAKQAVFDKVGMEHTTFGVPAGDRENFATLYQFDDATETYAPTHDQGNGYIFGTAYDSGGAGLVSTVSDMARFADVMCARGSVSGSVRILAPATVEMMRRDRFGASPAAFADFAGDALRGYGYGLGVRTLIDPVKAGASAPMGEFGWTGAAGAYMLMDPENEVAMFYTHHMLNNQEPYTAPRLRNILYSCLDA